MTRELSPVLCKNCVLFLVNSCYGKHWWFRLVREPLVWGMRILAWRKGIDARRHAINNPECHGCVRFMKAELEEKSPAFRFLNEYIGPWFRTLRDSMLTKEELDEAKRHAQEMMAPKREESGEGKSGFCPCKWNLGRGEIRNQQMIFREIRR